MTSTNPEYYTYRPTKLKVSRLGVNISKQMNDTLNLASSQYLIVGEQYLNQGGSTSNTYSLIVDEEGIAVNTSLVNRQANKNDFPVQLHGTVYVDGNIIVTGIISGSNSSNIIGGNSNFWKYAGNNNIYYDGKINIGNYNDSADNTYTVNISEPSNKDINKAQLGIQNRQLSELRVAILGSASNSPIIFNTPDSSGIEFHVGRKKDFFDSVYINSYSNDCGEWIENEATEIPYYDNSTEAPHLNIDKDGNVGVHTSYNHKLNYILRKSDSQYPEAISFTDTYEAMAMHVDGPMYARNVLIYDYETQKPKNLDEIFVRVVGQSILACNINPGPFPRGVFDFRSNLRIMTDSHTDYALHVNGDMKTNSNLYVDGDEHILGKYYGENIEINNNGSFSNNIYVQNNIYFKANLYKEVFNIATGSNEWALVQIDNTSLSNVSVSNIYNLGDGIATSGRLGIGVGPTTDEVNHQTVIRKRTSSIFELEMMDKTTNRIDKTAWIGHPAVASDKYNDASLVFVTPSATDTNYNKFYNRSPQNIYFFPGYERNISTFELTETNLPTLGIFENKKVGILTYEPQEALDVHGNIQLDGDIYVKRNGLLDPIKMGIWKAREYSYISVGSNVFKGIEYLDTNAAHVGINTIAQLSYGLVVDGKLMSLQGYYTKENYQMMPWYSSGICKNAILPPSQNIFTIGKVGIGMRSPESTLHVKASSGTTQLTMSQSEFSPSTILQMQGMYNNYMLHLNDVKNILEVYYGPSNQLYTSTSNRPLILKNGINHQVIINSNHDLLANDSDTLIVNGNVKVYGDMNITGDYRIGGAAITITSSQVEYIPIDNPNNIYIAGADILINPNQLIQDSVFVGYDDTYYNNYKSGLYYAPFNVLQRTDNPAYLTAKFTSIGETALIQIDSAKKNVVLNFGITEYNDLSFFTNQNRNRPFFAFKKDDIGSYTVGFGTTSPMEGAQVHIYNDISIGSNIFKITKKTNVDSADAAPGITLEKTVSSDSYKWKFVGPEESYHQKLQLFYQDPTKHKEIFTFTNDGCFGIGNTQPQFAVDIATGDMGSIRMYQSDPYTAKPQLLFQSGSNQYGADFSTDYRMYSYSNNFYVDMQDIYIGQKVLFHFTSNSSLGIHQEADSRYNVSINGSLNVKKNIFLNGREIFSVGDSINEIGTFIRGVNIILLPETDNEGGVVINYNGATSNLLYVASGKDGNMMVLDSAYNESQINFRVTENISEKRIYRLAASNQSFILEYSSNNIYDYEFDDKHDGFLRVVEWSPALKNRFDMNLDANLRLNKSDDPNIYLHNSVIGNSNLIFYILPEQSIGIGTNKNTRGYVHILNSNQSLPSVYIQSSNDTDILRLVQFENERLRINSYGNIGIGITNPEAALDIKGQIYISNGSSNQPSYSFKNAQNTGIYLDNLNNLSIATSNNSRIIVQDNGLIAINTSNISAQLHINNSTETVLKLETVSANLLECYNGVDLKLLIDSNGNLGIGTSIATNKLTIYGNSELYGDLLPSSNSYFNLGSSNSRWKDIYLSGNSIDLDNVRISKDTSGDLLFNLNSNNALIGLIANKYQLNTQNEANISIVKDPDSYLPMFVANDIGIDDSYVPLVLTKRLNAIGIGTVPSMGYMHIYANSNTPKVYIQSDIGDALQISGQDFLDLELDESFNYKKFKYQIDSQGIFNIGFGHTEYAGAPGLININENRYRHLLITNQKNDSYYQWIMQTNGVIKTVFDGRGNLGIGTAIPTASLHVEGRTELRLSDITQAALCVDGVADFNSNVYCYQNIEVTGDTICHGNTIQDSDRRLKYNIQTIESSLDKIKKLSGYTFNKVNQVRRQTGLIAQEVQEVLPEAVFEKEDGILGLDYGNLVGLMVEGIKELSLQLDEIKKRLDNV